MDTEQFARAKQEALDHFGDIEDRPRQVTVPERMTVESMKILLQRNYDRRSYVVDSIRDYVYNLPKLAAYSMSRLLPSEVVEKLASAHNGGAFADKILDCHLDVVASVDNCKEVTPETREGAIKTCQETIDTTFLKNGAFRGLLTLIGRLD